MAEQLKTYTLTVINKVYETVGAVTIMFKQPALKKIKYKAGQYITLIVNVDGRKYKRPYSISSVYGLDPTINITVKAIPDGVVSTYIVNQLNIGDTLEIIEPIGEYVYNEKTAGEHLYFWCAGSGITPNYSIIRDILANQLQVKKLSLIYCNKNNSNTIFGSTLNLLQTEHKDKFIIYNIHTEADELSMGAYYNKRLDTQCIQRLLNDSPIEADNAVHYICGPQKMKDLIWEELRSRGVPGNLVLSEDYQIEIDPLLLESVVDADMEVIVNNQLYTVVVNKGTTILNACLDSGVDLPYSCQSGTCRLCKAEVMLGEVLSTHYLSVGAKENECLTCCSFPKSSKLKLQIP